MFCYDSKVQIFQRLELNESSFPNFQRKFAYASVPPYLIAFSYLNVCLNLVISLVEITSYVKTPQEEKTKRSNKGCGIVIVQLLSSSERKFGREL